MSSPNDIGGMPITSMVGVGLLASNVTLDSAVNILPTDGIMGGDLKATIENLEAIIARFGCCYNELHKIILRKRHALRSLHFPCQRDSHRLQNHHRPCRFRQLREKQIPP